MYSDNDIVLNSLIKEKNNLNGIVMLSAFSLPEKFENRERIYRNLLKNKKTLHFIFEKLLFQKKENIVFFSLIASAIVITGIIASL